MIGTILNVTGILVGGIAGLIRRRPLSPASESYFKVLLSVFTVFYGLRLTWTSLGGTFLEISKQILIAIVALILGKLSGRALGLQLLSNRLGQYARSRIAATTTRKPATPGDGFTTCALLFCAAPLGILGSIQDGLSLSQYFYPLAIKAFVDGLAAMGFIDIFGWGVLLSALPVLAVQGTITLVCAGLLEPFLLAHNLINPINTVGGLLVFSVALVMLGLRRIELTDYLPSLIVAPLLSWFWP
jgi:uncharacterized membrane protein YqgA involved in biofilm formation